MKNCKVLAGVFVLLAWLTVGTVEQAQGQPGAPCVLIASDNSSVAIDTSPGVCVHVKTLAFNVGAISDIRVDFDLGHSHGCCHHQSLDFRLNLDGQPLFQEQLPFIIGAASGCANTQDRSATLSNVSPGAHTLDVFMCDEAQNCKLEVYECPPAQAPCEPVEDPDGRTQGFWKRVCRKPHPSGEHENLSGYVDCVTAAATFADVDDVDGLCDRLTPDPRNNKCEQAEAQFMALTLNLCSGRMEMCNCIDDPEFETVGEAVNFIDGLLSDPDRTVEGCMLAQGIADDINNGLTLVDCP